MNKLFLNRVDSACDQAFKTYGFQSRRRGSPLLPIGEDFYGWVGLNRYNRSGYLQLNPFVGLHCIPMMRIWYGIDDRLDKRFAGRTATFAFHMGEIAPHVEVFIFRDDANVEAEAARLAHCVHEFGVPWMKQHATLEAILPLLKSREAMLGGYPELIAIAMYLLGRHDEAIAYLDSKREEFLAIPSWREVASSWGKFAENLKAQIKEDSTTIPMKRTPLDTFYRD
jgi:hypothetical protein